MRDLFLVFTHRLIRLSLAGGQKGQSLVELALVLPLFSLILIGTAEVANFAWTSIIVSNAARAGAQYGIQNRDTASNTVGIGDAVAAEAPNLSGLTWTSSTSCACANGASVTAIACGTALTTCPSPSVILEYLQVNTTATITPLIHYPGLPSPFTTRGQAVMQVLQ